MQIDLQQGLLITQLIVEQVHTGLGHTDQVKSNHLSEQGSANAGQRVSAYRLNGFAILQVQAVSDCRGNGQVYPYLRIRYFLGGS